MRPILHQVRVPSLPRRVRPWPTGVNAPPPATGWIVGTQTFAQGGGESRNIALTGPSSYATGGIYDVDGSGVPLPANMAVTPAGLLQDSGAAEGTTNGVVFGYTEPGALPTLTLHTGAQSGTLPYMATVYPAEGAVPSGMTLRSSSDSSARSSVLSRWPDNSAQVMVLAGHKTGLAANSTATVTVQPTAVADGVALTTADIASKFTTGIAVDFGAVGSGTLNTWSSPDRTWWANSQVICARYRLAIGSEMEAVIDVHAFAGGRAFVEVVIENGKINAGAASPTAPSTKTYANATVSVNGASIVGGGINSPTTLMSVPNSRPLGGTYTGGHEAFRAWYCSAWIGGDPLVEVTHDTQSLRAHPWFFRPYVETSQNLQTKYAEAYDSYVPWATCRLRMPGMDGGADDQQIALLTEEQCDYVISGSKFSRRAVVATGLACHSAAFNWRHTGGEVPTHGQIMPKNTNTTWPLVSAEPRWGGPNTSDGSHIPIVGLVPFLCRPSPCFIELAQKEFAWNATNYASTDGTHPYDQGRSRAWRLRNYGATIWLTPDSDATRKAEYRAALARCIAVNNAFIDLPSNTLGALWTPEVGNPVDAYSRPGYQHALWFQYFCMMAWHSIDKAKILRDADATAWSTMVDRFSNIVIRRVNEAQGGEWRLHAYVHTLGTLSGGVINMSPGDWGYFARNDYGATPPASSGPWLTDPNGDSTITTWAGLLTGTSAGASYNYPEQFWYALCIAVERDIAGADAAWAKVTAGITNLNTWKDGFATYPRFNRYPRNK